jgi:hypothetical protein
VDLSGGSRAKPCERPPALRSLRLEDEGDGRGRWFRLA